MEAVVEQEIEIEEAPQHRRAPSDSVLRLSHDDDDDDDDDEQPSTGELAGVYLGVLNVYTTLPQFVSTFVSWIVFTLLQPSRNDVSDDDPDHHQMAECEVEHAECDSDLVFFIGACCSVVAAEATRRLI
jgi:solute carrier family 45, member 1/2/4